ncbi:MAG: pyruvate formate-lyase-activating protein [Candidatus Nanopelagicales bacterium]
MASFSGRNPRARVGYVHSAETTSGVNGPGLRYTMFLAGCPLRCLYCHNPDTQTAHLGERTDVERVITDIGRYRAFLRNGGLTITGGEPLMQAAFAEEVFVGVKTDYDNMHTCLDTSAHGSKRVTDRLLDHTDLVLLDIKAGNPELYERVTGGGSFQTLLEFAARLVERENKMWIRFVQVPGLTDSDEQVAEVADLCVELGEAVERVEILPYHRLGVDKYAALGRAYPLEGTLPPPMEEVDHALAIFRERGLYTLA